MAEKRSLPLLIIEPVDGSINLGLKEIWQQRHLFYWLTWRDIKVRYKHTLIGVVWARSSRSRWWRC